MPISVVVAAVAAVASMPVLWWALSGRQSTTVGARNLLVGQPAFTDMRQAVLAHSASDRAVRPMVERLAKRAKRFSPNGVTEALERRILLAGAPAAWRIERVLAGKLVFGVGGLAIGVYRFLTGPSLGRLVFAFGAGALGYFAPDLSLRNRATKRQQQIGLELPDTLDQITISVEAGLGFDAAMSRTARTGKGP
ncbi:MAG: type II secretion system F family protein, partial [Acidimicrobiales bacterium]